MVKLLFIPARTNLKVKAHIKGGANCPVAAPEAGKVRQNTNGKKRSKEVAFGPLPQGQIAQIEGKTEAQKDKLWYSSKEYGEFALESFQMACLSRASPLLSDLFGRGLETLISPQSTKRRKLMHQRKVLTIYRMQRQLGVHDPEELRLVSEESSRRAVKHAFLLGCLDAKGL